MASPRDTLTSYVDVGELNTFVGDIVQADWPVAKRFCRGASRRVDAYCNRIFIELTASTLVVDVEPGQESAPFALPWDLLSKPTKYESDTDLDDTFKTNFTADVKARLLGSAAPYWGLIFLSGATLAVGPGTLRLTADWGWPRRVDVVAGQTVQDNPLSAAATTLTVQDATKFAVAQTLRIESEQLVVEDRPTSTTLTVTRGHNGSTAAAHVQGTAISLYRFPEEVFQASGIIAARLWRRRDSAYTPTVPGGPEPAANLIDTTVRELLAQLVRHPV